MSPTYRNRESGIEVTTEVPDARLEKSWDRVDAEPLGPDGPGPEEQEWPSTHKALDALAAEFEFEWPEGATRVVDKQAALTEHVQGGARPEEE